MCERAKKHIGAQADGHVASLSRAAVLPQLVAVLCLLRHHDELVFVPTAGAHGGEGRVDHVELGFARQGSVVRQGHLRRGSDVE